MTTPAKRKAPKRASPLVRLAKTLYFILFGLSLVVVVSYVGLKVFAPAPDVPDQMEFELDPDDLPEQADGEGGTKKMSLNRRKGVYTCLLLGVAGQGGCDTIMLGVFDTKAKTASLISIPRDTVIYSGGKYRKINSTYAGGEEAVAAAVRDLLGVPVDYYVSVNLKAFSSIVDQIGGVWFDVPVRMDYRDPLQDLVIDIQPGYQLLDGKKAEGVMRCRNCYVNADIGRTATQRAFLTALAKQAITPSNVTNVTSLINTFSQYVSSDMPLSDMVFFGTQAIGMDLDTALNASSLEGEWISPYWQLDDQAVLELINSLGVYEETVPAQALHIVHP